MSLNLNRFILFVALPGLLAGCEEIVDFPEESHYTKLPVVEALLTNRFEPQRVRVSYTSALSDSLSCVPVSNANVLIYSDKGDTAVFSYESNGWYVSQPFSAEVGKLYTLYVETGGMITRSYSELIPEKTIDSLYYKRDFKGKTSDTIYHIYLNAGEIDSSDVRYYILQAFINSKDVTRGDEMWIFDDKYLYDMENIELPADIRPRDTVDIELHTLTKPMYDYFLGYANILFADQMVNQNYRVNPPLMFDQQVLGYFKVSAVSRKRIIVGK